MDEVVRVARHGEKLEISQEALEKMAATRAHIESLAAAETPVYGISTGFGALANKHIAPEDRVQLQKSLIRSHAAGMGDPVEKEVVRALMLLRTKTLASGRTGVRPVVAQTYVDLLNSGITPIVHEYGSLGCSGDLAPLAHCAMVLMGEGRATGSDGVERDVPTLLKEAGIKPIELQEKEGLALINGTDGMLGMLILALADLEKLCDQADVIAAMSVEAQMGTDQVFRPELHEALRPHPGQAKSAANMFAALAGSEVVASHKEGDDKVQDAYSLRCAPQVAGAVRDTVSHATLVATRELASTIDNPVVLESGEVTSNGNFHTGIATIHAIDDVAKPQTVNDNAERVVPKDLPTRKYAVNANALRMQPNKPMASKVRPFQTWANIIKPSKESAMAPHIELGTKCLRTYLIQRAIQIGAVNSITRTRLNGIPRWIPRK
jgi:histidine ammonia-lyase